MTPSAIVPAFGLKTPGPRRRAVLWDLDTGSLRRPAVEAAGFVTAASWVDEVCPRKDAARCGLRPASPCRLEPVADAGWPAGAEVA